MTHDRRMSENNLQRAERLPASDDEPSLRKCRCSKAIRQLIRDAIQADRRRAAVEEAEQWESCFGATAPSNWKAKQRRIVQVASGRAVLALLNKPNYPHPSFDDFFPEET